MSFSGASDWALLQVSSMSWPSLAALIAASAVFVYFILQTMTASSDPLALRDPIPGVFNAAQFVLNNHKLMVRVQRALKDSNLVRFYMGRTPVYLATGPRSIRTMFSRELVHQVTNQEQMTRFALPTLYRMNAEEVQRWASDGSGVAKTPIPGTESIPPRHRLWFNYEHVYAEYLGLQYLRPLVHQFQQGLDEALSRYPSDKWTSVNVQELCRREVSESSVSVLFGPDLIGSCPDFIDRFWAFDQHVFKLIVGYPKWLNSAPYDAHDRYVAAIEAWLGKASKGFDWESEEAVANWEPRFGGRAVRELVRWMNETDWRSETIAATLGALVFAIPTTIWMLMEIIKDPSLLQAVREEVDTARIADPVTGRPTLDSQKVATLPLLQSVWTEVLRLQINFNITRDVKEEIVLDGQTIAPGALLQAPMMVSHYAEDVWGAAGHPASEFWAERHIKHSTDEAGRPKRTYAMAGRPTSYFPFGGGANMCPGRQFAKYEVMLTIAMIVSQFDIELEGWTTMDGSPSDRPARSDLTYCGAGAMPPDREMKLRWRRRA